MKIFILKENLKKGLDIIERIISKNITLPILSNVLITTEKNFLKLSATDLEIGINFWVLAKINKEGKITIPAKFFSNVINYLPDDKIFLEQKNQILYLEYNNNKIQIKGYPFEDFPILPLVNKEKFFGVDVLNFSHGLLQVIENTSPTLTRPEISGVFLCFNKDLITFVATDSFRLAEKKITGKFNTSPSFKPTSLILPQKTARELINILSDKKGELKVYFSPNQIMLEITDKDKLQPQIQITSRLIEGDYPNYQEIIPKTYETEIVVKKNDFLNQIKLAGLFSGKINEVKLNVDPQKSGLKIFAQSPDYGQTETFLPGQVKGKKAGVVFNWRFLIDGIANIKSQEVVLGLNKEEGPAILKPVGDESYIYVVMPIKSS